MRRRLALYDIQYVLLNSVLGQQIDIGAFIFLADTVDAVAGLLVVFVGVTQAVEYGVLTIYKR